MGYTVIAPAGDNLKALFIGIKEFPTKKVILITPNQYIKEAKIVQEKLKIFTIEVEIFEIDSNIMEEMFRAFGKINSTYNYDDLIVNVATGDRLTTCAALSAAYANGLKSFGVMGNQCMLLPIMKLSYYHELSENKLHILEKLELSRFISLRELSKKLGMSVSLLSYHINGNFKSKGLKEFRLIEVKEEKNNLYIKLSQLGSLLLKGYIPQTKS